MSAVARRNVPVSAAAGVYVLAVAPAMTVQAFRRIERSQRQVACPLTPSGSVSVAVRATPRRGRVADRETVPASSMSVMVTVTERVTVTPPCEASTVTS